MVGEPLGLFHHPEQIFQPYLGTLPRNSEHRPAQADLRRQLVVGMTLDPGGPAVGREGVGLEQIISSGSRFDTITLNSSVASLGP